MHGNDPDRPGLRRAVATVAALNLGYFGVEFAVALTIGSVALFADSIDFLEDASINSLILLALRWTAARRARAGMALAAILLVPGLATLLAAWEKFGSLAPPAPVAMTLTGLGALAVNLACAYLLARHRHVGGSLTTARLSVGAERRAGERGDHRRSGADGGDTVGLARSSRRARNRASQRRRRARSVAGGARRAAGRRIAPPSKAPLDPATPPRHIGGAVGAAR